MPGVGYKAEGQNSCNAMARRGRVGNNLFLLWGPASMSFITQTPLSRESSHEEVRFANDRLSVCLPNNQQKGKVAAHAVFPLPFSFLIAWCSTISSAMVDRQGLELDVVSAGGVENVARMLKGKAVESSFLLCNFSAGVVVSSSSLLRRFRIELG